MIANAPMALLDAIAARHLEGSALSFAAEIAGEYTDSAAVRRVLLPLITDGNLPPPVREGAIYGIGRHLDEQVTATLQRVADDAQNPTLAEVAAGALDE